MGTGAFFLNYLLHTDQGASLQTKVDAFNALLQPLADVKNAAVPTSPVWVIDASAGFDPVTMTHDKVHPNLEGEAFVGRRIAGRFGIDSQGGNLSGGSAEESRCVFFGE